MGATFLPSGHVGGSHGTGRAKWLDTQENWRSDSHGPVDQETKAQQCQVRNALSHWPVPVSRFSAGQSVLLGKSHRLSISGRLSESLVALCLFFCHTKEWKGVFPQPVRQPSLVLSSEASSPLCSSAQHICVFSAFLLQVKGCHLAWGKKSTCDTGSWQS